MKNIVKHLYEKQTNRIIVLYQSIIIKLVLEYAIQYIWYSEDTTMIYQFIVCIHYKYI